VAALTAVLGALVGPQALPYASAYIVIGCGALIGSVVALFRRAPCSPIRSLGFIGIMWAVAMGCTAPAAEWISRYLNQPVAWLLFPVSLGIAAVGEDWLRIPVLDWIAAGMSRLRGQGPKNDA
jgi:hypothetical protein